MCGACKCFRDCEGEIKSFYVQSVEADQKSSRARDYIFAPSAFSLEISGLGGCSGFFFWGGGEFWLFGACSGF